MVQDAEIILDPPFQASCPRCDKTFTSTISDAKALQLVVDHIKRSDRPDHQDLDWFEEELKEEKRI